MKIAIAMSKPQYFAGESIKMTVEYANEGPAPIALPRIHSNDNWQPTYTVVGPGYPEGRTTSFRSAVWGEIVPADAEADTIQLAAGATHGEELPIGQLLNIAVPGTYTIRADLSWKGLEAHSTSVPFVVGPSTVKTCQFSAQPGLSDTTGVSAFCLLGSGSEPPQIHLAAFRIHPQSGKVIRSGLTRFAPARDGAESMVGLWEACPQGKEGPAARVVYRAGSRVGAVGYEDPGMELELPFSPRFIAPALGPMSGEVDIFVVNGDGTQLGLVRFSKKRTGFWYGLWQGLREDIERNRSLPLPLPKFEERGPRLLWTTKTPASIVGGRAALSASGVGDERHAVLVADEPDGALLMLADAKGGKAVPELLTVRIPNLHARPHLEPGLLADDEGRGHASAILESPPRPDGSVEVWLAEAIWDRYRKAPHVETSMLARLPAPPRAAATTYSPAGSVAWAIVAANGEVKSSTRGSAGVPLKGSPSSPLDLLMVNGLFVMLTFDSEGVPNLERL